MTEEKTICENCEQPIEGQVVRTGDDYELCSDCKDCFEPIEVVQR